MPAFKYRQKIFLMVLERGHKARAYECATLLTDLYAI